MVDSAHSGDREREAPLRRRGRALRLIVLAIFALPLLFVALLIGSIVLLPSIVSNERVRDQAVRALTDALGVAVSIERLEYDPLTGFEVFGVRIGPPPGFERDVARIERVAVHYDLSEIFSRRLVVREVAVESPHLSVETKLGQDGAPIRNLDVLSARLASAPPAPAEPSSTPPAASRPGPRSPISVSLEKLALTDLGLEAVGVGPNLRFSGLALTGHAGVDPERLSVELRLQIAPGAGASENLLLSLPASADAPESGSELAFTLTSSLAASADTRAGVVLDAVSLGLMAQVAGRAHQGDLPLPPIELRAGGKLVLDPRADRVGLSRFVVDLGRARLVDAELSIEGVAAALADAIGAPAADALAASIGLAKKHPEGVVMLRVKMLALPLAALAPYAKAFVPGLAARGTIALRPLELEGTPGELLRGDPRSLRLVLDLDDVSGSVTHPKRMHLGAMSGTVELARRPEVGGFGLTGQIALRDLEDGAGASMRAVDVTLSGGLERLAYPMPGATTVAVDVRLRGARVPGIEVDRLELGARCAGQDVAAFDRALHPPINLGLRVALGNLRAMTGTVAHEASGLSLGVEARLDRLVAPAEGPIGLVAQLGLERAASGVARVRAASARVEGQVSDPRSGAPIDAQVSVTLGAGAVESPSATLERPEVTAKLGLEAIAPRALFPGPPALAPAAADVELSVSLPAIRADDPKLGALSTHGGLRFSGAVDLERGSAVLRSVALDLADVLRVRASGRSSGVFRPRPTVDLRLQVLPVDLALLVARVPPGLRSPLTGLEASGTVAFESEVKGVVPGPSDRIDLAEPPISGEVALILSDIGLKDPARKLSLSGLTGRLGLDIVRGRTELSSDVELAQLEASNGALDGLRYRMHAGLRGEVWSLTSDLDAQAMKQAGATAEAPRLAVDVAYTKGGELEVRRFDVAVPLLGIELDAKGRLMRRDFGVLRPELAVKGRVDLDRLAPYVPAMRDTHGRIALGFDADSRADSALDLRGAIDLEHVSHRRPGLVIENATGHVPFEQRLALGRPVLREAVAASEGALGDDLEQRLEELKSDLLGAKLYFDETDILLEPPRSADHQSLRPYYGQRGASVTIESVTSAGHLLRSVVFDALWRSGVVRLDRFAARIWEGDVLGDIAVQLTADQDAHARFRATLTNLNLDIPYAQAQKIEPVSDPTEKRKYSISGTIDTGVLVRDHVIVLKMDLTRLDKPTLERLFDGLIDPERKNPAINNARTALDSAGFMGLRMAGGQMSISQNRFGAHFDFDRVWFDISESAWLAPLAPFRWVVRLVFGPIIIANVNGAFADKFPLTYWIQDAFDRLQLENSLKFLSGRVIAEDRPTGAAASGGAP